MEITHKIGRRKTAIARVYIQPGNGNVEVNKKDYKVYFPTLPLQYIVNQAFEITNNKDKYDVKVNVEGGGITGQAEAIRLGITRALVHINEENKPALKAQGLLTRDPRMVERKKPGQKKARKRFQFSKR
ncbi:MAG: 30S ribosomal protein S9 [Bacteroidia bacterium]|nr:30S ribosomal protein S9 [Bacteroidota bacterium]MBP9083112.1 30S ribosomal protein S9 [Bacteroidia bacterium]MBK7388942.1 30S ribosomal protein S9 [Bacteroidota bacterium]MBK8415829.1 30S ribosomal protein S9 [Bacteroidota bacterium]MBK8873285.1 30S ribosomal protein S9 [Bacteroidota bacterium]